MNMLHEAADTYNNAHRINLQMLLHACASHASMRSLARGGRVALPFLLACMLACMLGAALVGAALVGAATIGAAIVLL
jgi:hypothetical protein